MVSETKEQRIVREAADLMGRTELAGRMKAAVADIEAWIDGSAKVPQRTLLLLAEVLVNWSGKQRF